MERPATVAEDSGWVFLTEVPPLFVSNSYSATTEITPQGRGRDRLYLIPSGHLVATGRESVKLPPVDDLI